MVPTIPLRRRRRWPWIVLLLIVVGAAGVGVGTLRGGASGGNGKVKADDLDLRLGKSDVRDIQVTVNEVGTIEPVVKVDVKSNLSGKVIDLLVLEGDKVRAGQVLARVEPDATRRKSSPPSAPSSSSPRSAPPTRRGMSKPTSASTARDTSPTPR